jgi:hypothetical protein
VNLDLFTRWAQNSLGRVIMDADDFTRCPGCDRSICLVDGAYSCTCLKCFQSICFTCLEEKGIITLPPKRASNKYVDVPSWPEASWFHELYLLAEEDSESEASMELFDAYGEPGFYHEQGCPWCPDPNVIYDEALLAWMIKRSGKTREQLEQDFKNS